MNSFAIVMTFSCNSTVIDSTIFAVWVADCGFCCDVAPSKDSNCFEAMKLLELSNEYMNQITQANENKLTTETKHTETVFGISMLSRIYFCVVSKSCLLTNSHKMPSSGLCHLNQ
jgi:hypothetical protein